ncbi:MAG: hypothetical protein MMC33_008300 [Icmadophila ericetorum]|nr:hypothetical protein [Icmadophila ericetorum]
MPRLITDTEGWTHVKSKRPHAPPKREERRARAEREKDLDLERILARYQNYLRRWKDSTSYPTLVAFFEVTLLKLEDLQVTSCICTGLGSLTESPHLDAGPSASLWQLAILETMLELLGKKFTIHAVSFQDPAFNDLDEEVLQSKGYKIVQDPAASKLMTSTTFLFAPCNGWWTIAHSLEVAHPSLFIGNNLHYFMECYTLLGLGPNANRYRDTYQSFLTGRSFKNCPPFEGHVSALEGQAIFWKPDDGGVPQTGQVLEVRVIMEATGAG